MNDEELRSIVVRHLAVYRHYNYDALRVEPETFRVMLDDVHEAADAIIRAVRAAIGPGLPVIPDGWRLAGIVDFRDQRRFGGDGLGYKVSLMTTDDEATGWADGYGVRWEDAIAAAIRAAEGGRR